MKPVELLSLAGNACIAQVSLHTGTRIGIADGMSGRSHIDAPVRFWTGLNAEPSDCAVARAERISLRMPKACTRARTTSA